jgi:hypothetical protein
MIFRHSVSSFAQTLGKPVADIHSRTVKDSYVQGLWLLTTRAAAATNLTMRKALDGWQRWLAVSRRMP